MGGFDNQMDVDEDGVFHFEYTQCPLAGECFEWKVSCFPTENTAVSDAQMKVLKLIAEGHKVKEIAEMLCLSPYTVEKHTNNMLRKLGIHSNAALVNYYHKHH